MSLFGHQLQLYEKVSQYNSIATKNSLAEDVAIGDEKSDYSTKVSWKKQLSYRYSDLIVAP